MSPGCEQVEVPQESYRQSEYEGGKSKTFTVAEWAAFESTDKDFRAFGNNKAWGAGASIFYTPPAGKTLYITQVTGRTLSTLQEDADNNQICSLSLQDFTAGILKLDIGGNGGAGFPLYKPLVIPGGNLMVINFDNLANHNCS
ncbi:unnamed protein product, partial [marine sediment metagenome]